MKRENYLSWNDFFVNLAVLTSLRSKDPNTQVGCCIVDEKNRIVSVGYNGMPAGCDDDTFSWEKPEKYQYVVHAEINAILNSKLNSVENCVLYTTLFPCNECTKVIIQSGIKQIFYLDDHHSSSEATQKMLSAAKIQITKISENSILFQ